MMGGPGTLRPEFVRLVSWNASANRDDNTSTNALAKLLGMTADWASTAGTTGYPFG